MKLRGDRAFRWKSCSTGWTFCINCVPSQNGEWHAAQGRWIELNMKPAREYGSSHKNEEFQFMVRVGSGFSVKPGVFLSMGLLCSVFTVILMGTWRLSLYLMLNKKVFRLTTTTHQPHAPYLSLPNIWRYPFMALQKEESLMTIN